MWDFPEATDLGKVASQIYRNEGLVSAVCHGVVGLLPVTDESGKSILAGRTVTGFSNEEEEANGTTNEVPFLAEDALKEKELTISQVQLFRSRSNRWTSSYRAKPSICSSIGRSSG